MEVNSSNENNPKKIEEKNEDKNLDSESEVISGLMGEILDKVVDIVKSPQSVASNLVNKPLQQIQKEKDVVSQSDSPPSSNTRIGVEAKKFISENPKITRTLETNLRKSNIPVLRKIEALEKAKTPQKRGPTLKKLKSNC